MAACAIETDAPINAADTALETAPPRYLTPSPATFANYTCCPSATTLIYLNHETARLTLWPVTCKRWGCAYCAKRKVRRLAYLTHEAQPNRWIRLGVNPALYAADDPAKSAQELAWRDTSPKVPELFRKLKTDYGPIEYLRVCEIHNGTTKYAELEAPGKARGFPHYHAMIRSAFIPQKALSRVWGDLTGAPVVWIARIDQSFSSFRYLTKYLTKLHRLDWTNRHVSYSRGFFPPEATEKLAKPQQQVISQSKDHPWKYLTDNYGWQQVALNPDGSYTLPWEKDPGEQNTPIDEFNLCGPPLPTAEHRQSQPFLAEW
ncbi:MAG: hypothetical protein ABSG25_02960 [Bryobacteraceae bacterium]